MDVSYQIDALTQVVPKLKKNKIQLSNSNNTLLKRYDERMVSGTSLNTFFYLIVLLE
jgi:hypothetical protein